MWQKNLPRSGKDRYSNKTSIFSKYVTTIFHFLCYDTLKFRSGPQYNFRNHENPITHMIFISTKIIKYDQYKNSPQLV